MNFKPSIIKKKKITALEKALHKQRREIIGSKTAAKKFLTDLGVFQILVPNGTNLTFKKNRI